SPVKLRLQPKVHRTRACEWEHEARDGAETFRLSICFERSQRCTHSVLGLSKARSRAIHASWVLRKTSRRNPPSIPKPPATCNFPNQTTPNPDSHRHPTFTLRPHLYGPVHHPTTTDSSPPPTPDGQPSRNEGHDRTQPQRTSTRNVGFRDAGCRVFRLVQMLA
ncbi:hypothetical protein DFP72DRAFT_908312, partial [Ephemerocybe angulata]